MVSWSRLLVLDPPPPPHPQGVGVQALQLTCKYCRCCCVAYYYDWMMVIGVVDFLSRMIESHSFLGVGDFSFMTHP
jgi:hypothetical protein